ncbi:MAG: WecB/TagA/CpsF family glycosyltransferase [Eubacteriales bacterium]|nr:WecB/TagA/CpsF family glycosyltransferase [Eubacteriales bacterium]
MKKTLAMDGVRFDIFSEDMVTESMRPALETEGIKTVIRLNPAALEAALAGERVAADIAAADLILCAGEDIGTASEDVVSGGFYLELFEFLGDGGVVLLTATEELMERLKDFLAAKYPALRVLSERICSEDENPESLVNMINNYVPDAVIAALPSPQQERLLVAHKAFMNTKWCVGLGEKPEILGYTRSALLGIFKGKDTIRDYIKTYEVTAD